MHKSAFNIAKNIDPSIVLNKTRIVKCIAKIKLVLDKNENQIPGFKKNTPKK